MKSARRQLIAVYNVLGADVKSMYNATLAAMAAAESPAN